MVPKFQQSRLKQVQERYNEPHPVESEGSKSLKQGIGVYPTNLASSESSSQSLFPRLIGLLSLFEECFGDFDVLGR
jgi:hypothetical protein